MLESACWELAEHDCNEVSQHFIVDSIPSEKKVKAL